MLKTLLLPPLLFLVLGLSSCALLVPVEVVPDEDRDIAQSCRGDVYRQFDFWLGDWNVVSDRSDGAPARNTITRIVQGCALQERYRTQTGYDGKSLSWFETTSSTWRQTWVDNSGVVLELSGGLNARGQMVLLGGPRTTNQAKTVLDRISWTPLEDGSVQQIWELSEDKGLTWQTVFNGLYVLRAAPAVAGQLFQ